MDADAPILSAGARRSETRRLFLDAPLKSNEANEIRDEEAPFSDTKLKFKRVAN